MSKQIGVAAISIVVILVIVVAVLGGALSLNLFTHTTTTQTATTCGVNGCVRQLPIHFTFKNQYTNQIINSSLTATVFKGTPLAYDYTTTLSGVWDTTKTFTSGESYTLYAVNGNSKYEFALEVPLAASLTQSSFPVSVSMVQIGSYALSVLGSDGKPVSSYNVTSNTPSFVYGHRHQFARQYWAHRQFYQNRE